MSARSWPTYTSFPTAALCTARLSVSVVGVTFTLGVDTGLEPFSRSLCRGKRFCRTVSPNVPRSASRFFRCRFGSRALSCSNVHGVFPFTSFLVLPCPSVYNPFLLFATFSHGTCERRNKCADYLRRQLLLRIWCLLTVLFQTLKDQDFAQVRWRRRSMKFTYRYHSSCKTRLGSKVASKRLLRQWPPRLPRLPILSQFVGTSLETTAASVSSSPDSTRPWNILGQSTGSTATGSLGSHGPGSSDDKRTCLPTNIVQQVPHRSG